MTEPGERPYPEQLTETLAFAVEHIPWYRDRAEQYAGPIETTQDLARLPIIDRDTVAADPLAFTSSDGWPTSISYSSSTTGGIGRPRWRNAAELDAYHSLIRARRNASRSLGGDDGDGHDAGGGVTLVIHPYDQGAPDGPGDGEVARRVYVGMFVPWHFDLIHEILRDGWLSPAGRLRVTEVDCFSPGLRILTEWFEQRGVDPRSFGVQRLIGYGSIQPHAWRRRLRAGWGADYRDLYGLSELVLSDAADCPLCHAYHYSMPIIPEVVDPVTRRPIERGTGVLVLSELYPYAQLQLMMRYWTDDLVELARPCPIGGFGIFFRGRVSSSVVIARDRRAPLTVGSLQIGELCAEIPDVAVAPITWAQWAPNVGAPRFELSDDEAGAVIRLTVELRYAPALFPDRAAQVRAELAEAVRAEVSGLADALDAGTVRLDVATVGPSALTAAVEV